MKLSAYSINCGVNSNSEFRPVVSGSGISMTISVIIIARIASINASRALRQQQQDLNRAYTELSKTKKLPKPTIIVIRITILKMRESLREHSKQVSKIH
jgi:hypothetical protein